MSDIESIDGTITLEDGTKVSFSIDPDDGGYSQWGAPTSVLGTVGVRGPVDYTVVHGRVTVEHGHLVTVDEEKLAHDADAKCRAYLNR